MQTSPANIFFPGRRLPYSKDSAGRKAVLRAQLTNLRIRTFITSPNAKNTNNVADPP
jgi:hypothetical protein